MGDGKALQMGTSHELGQNFAKAFDIRYLDADGAQQFVWTTSWGVSTRMVGGLIMGHGDDRGLRLPPRLAPIQVVVMAVRDDPEVLERCRALAAELTDAGLRVRLDDQVERVGRAAQHRLGAQGRARAPGAGPPRPGRGRGDPGRPSGRVQGPRAPGRGGRRGGRRPGDGPGRHADAEPRPPATPAPST